MKIVGIKTPNKLFVAEQVKQHYTGKYNYNSLSKYVINGEPVGESFLPNWSAIDSEPITVERWKSQPAINKRFELMEPDLACERIPLIVAYEDAVGRDADSYEYWKEPYAQYKSLYKFFEDNQEPVLVPVEFEYEQIAEVDKLPEQGSYVFAGVSANKVYHEFVDTLLYPEPLLAGRPSALSAKDSYNLIRTYVKQHIDYSVAKIKSDYDFCFEVAKIIPLSETEQYTVVLNALSKRKKKYEQRYRSARSVTIFRMAPTPYQDYPVVVGFAGATQTELSENIERYLSDLIATINEPVKDCPHCKGRGVLFNG